MNNSSTILECSDGAIADVSNLLYLGSVENRSPTHCRSYHQRQRREPERCLLYPPTRVVLSLLLPHVDEELFQSTKIHRRQQFQEASYSKRPRCETEYRQPKEKSSAFDSQQLPPGAYDCSYDPATGAFPKDLSYARSYYAKVPTPKSPAVLNPKPHQTYTGAEIEIEPGVYEPLRGSQETWDALQNGFGRSVQCSGCTSSLVCIADAAFVICPECKVISPTAYPMGMQTGNYGVGLGLHQRNCGYE